MDALNLGLMGIQYSIPKTQYELLVDLVFKKISIYMIICVIDYCYQKWKWRHSLETNQVLFASAFQPVQLAQTAQTPWNFHPFFAVQCISVAFSHPHVRAAEKVLSGFDHTWEKMKPYWTQPQGFLGEPRHRSARDMWGWWVGHSGDPIRSLQWPGVQCTAHHPSQSPADYTQLRRSGVAYVI